MFASVKRSLSLIQISATFLSQHKRLLVFPMFSFFGVLGSILGFGYYLLKFEDLGDWFYTLDHEVFMKEEYRNYVGLFILYCIEYLIIHFFSSALIASVMRMFTEKKLSVGYGLYIAVCRIPQILAWSILSALFDIILSLLEKINDHMASVIVWILGETWFSSSFFVIPVIVDEGVGPVEACRRSVSRVRRRWGESYVGGVVMGYLFMFSVLGIAAFLFGMEWLSGRYNLGFESMEYWAVGGVFFVLACVVSSAIHSIYVCLLYTYALEYDLPEGIDSIHLAHVLR